MEPESPDIDHPVAALLAELHCAHRLVRPVMWSTLADFMRVAAIIIASREGNLVGIAGALDAAAQPVLARLISPQTS